MGSKLVVGMACSPHSTHVQGFWASMEPHRSPTDVDLLPFGVAALHVRYGDFRSPFGSNRAERTTETERECDEAARDRRRPGTWIISSGIFCDDKRRYAQVS
jgi:hypothetical protein